MRTRKLLLSALPILLVLSMVAAACGTAASPAQTAAPAAAAKPTQPPAPTAAPAAAAKPAEAPKPAASPVAAKPAEAPKPAAAALDLKATLDKYFSGLPEGFGLVQSAALKEQMAAAKPFLVEVREAKEVADNGLIEGSVNIPIRTLLKNLDKLPARDQAIVVICGSGHRSALGMMALQMLGYTNVKSLAGGFGAWKSASLPVATGKPADPVAGKAPEVDRELLAALDRYMSALPEGFSLVQAAALKEQLEAAKPFHFDVREPKEITDNGYIAGAVQVPVRGLIKNLDKLPPDRAAAIIAECGSGHRSALAMMGLNLLGYTNVKSLAGGFGAWKAANLPIAR